MTALDLSDNHLNLLHSKALKKLRHFDHLIKLNLSGNYLPLLVKKHFYHFPSLEILDLSGCKLTTIKHGALLSFPRLQKLFLGNNDLQTPMSAVLRGHEWVEAVDYTSNLQASDRPKDAMQVGANVCRKKTHSGDGMWMSYIVQNVLYCSPSFRQFQIISDLLSKIVNIFVILLAQPLVETPTVCSYVNYW